MVHLFRAILVFWFQCVRPSYDTRADHIFQVMNSFWPQIPRFRAVSPALWCPLSRTVALFSGIADTEETSFTMRVNVDIPVPRMPQFLPPSVACDGSLTIKKWFVSTGIIDMSFLRDIVRYELHQNCSTVVSCWQRSERLSTGLYGLIACLLCAQRIDAISTKCQSHRTATADRLPPST